VPTSQVGTAENAKQEDIFEESILLPFSKHSKELAETDATESKQSVAPKPIQNEPRKQAMEDLLQFSDKDFVAVLHACRPQTVLLALSGASKAFVSRVERLVPAKDVKRLRERLNGLGKIQLREVDAAQMEIAEVAMKLLANGAVGATASVSFTAAA
jgi:flagellar motor switch protein FliG